MIWLKQGAIGDLHREMRRALGKLTEHFEHVFITSIRDGAHMSESLHYDGKAIDCRFRLDVIGATKQDVQSLLGTDFDVVEYSTFFHIEYDPEGRER